MPSLIDTGRGWRIPRAESALIRDVDWGIVAETGTPLIEPLGGGECAVTFLWRDADPAARPFVLANKLHDRRDPEGSAMQLMPGTDVWFLTYRLPSDWRGSYQIGVGPAPAEGAVVTGDGRVRVADGVGPAHRDPYCRRQLGQKSVVELPDAPPQPYRARRAGVPRGDVSVERVAGAPVWHYASAGAEDDAPMVVVLDGSLWAGELDLPTTLDNLVADRAIPPLRATMVDTGAGDTRAALLLDNDDFVAWLAGDLLDALNVAGPAMVAGQSLGGLSALRAALARPDRFSAVLAQSASLWTPAADRLPVRAGARAYLEVGTDEWINAGPNAAFAERLAAAGSAVEFREFRGGHDRACWRGGIADGLISLLG